ncbi:MAG: radical SAM protein [Desulfobacca sp.]|uniref:radical SAM protein n=1 Tax=Desulfobacca sp. TaxID=2067990 RepID=UPI00404B3EF5
MMTQTVCRPFCAYYKPAHREAEKCLAAELLTTWCHLDPSLNEALALAASAAAAGHPAPGDRGRENSKRTKHGQLLEEQVCGRCVFRRHGCDFAAGEPGAPPCGGFLALARLLASGAITAAQLPATCEQHRRHGFLRLAEHVSLRLLEAPHLYDRLADELYEVDETGFAWLSRCDGTTPGLAPLADQEFVDFLLAESLLACLAAPAPRPLSTRQSPIPSWRYLELLLTERCNLRCRHCYLGDTGAAELPLAAVLDTLAEFQRLQGLRVLLSGGEPLLYRWWQELNERLPEFDLRFVLLTNGLLLTDAVIHDLNVQEVQISLDGLAHGHELIRGPGTWQKTVARLEALLKAGMPVSVATMIHQGNLTELPHLHTWLQGLGIREWNLDIPCISGKLTANADLWVDPLAGVPYLDLAFGGSDHGASGDYACGRHLAAVLPNGTVAKCGLYADQPLGTLSEGLKTCWQRLQHIRLQDLDCASCPHILDCRGGCRFRAGRGLAPDPVMCARYGVDPESFNKR